MFDIALPPWQVPIAMHSHAGHEFFLVMKGDLRVTVAGVVHDLGESQEMAVKQEFHGPPTSGIPM
jgi:mannose-6-phosphate isomerase-like protein (cupin superfamily)